MQKYQLFLTMRCQDTIRHLPPLVKPAIRKLIQGLAERPYAGKALADDLQGFYRLRFQRWRAVYSMEKNKERIVIHLIEQRHSVYETLKSIAPQKLHEAHRLGYQKPTQPSK